MSLYITIQQESVPIHEFIARKILGHLFEGLFSKIDSYSHKIG